MNDAPSTRTAAAVNAVARETLRRIALERISPTPETYQRIYQEIAATHPDHPGQGPAPGGGEGKASAALIARLLTQLDAHHSGITVTRKREGLKRALVPRLEPLDALYGRLNRLMDSWNGPNAEAGQHVSQFLGTDVLAANHLHEPDAAAERSPDDADRVSSASRARAMPSHAQTGHAIARSAGDLPERMISYRLASLLALLLKNIDELTPESALLGNQIEQIGRVLTAPLTEKKLDEAERCLRALIVRQSAIKHSIDETKRAVRELAESLLGRLSTLVDSTDSYSTKIVEMAERIAGTDDLGQLSMLTQVLVTDSRTMSASVAAERALLVEAEARARHLQERTVALENELREASMLVRTDPLTHAMNRRGFGDAYKTEMIRADGGALPIVALIDVDNFKRINEEHGHSVGDEVLCNVVEVLHRCATPGNVVARYGGEEFALMFPDLSIDETEQALGRMQQALTEHLGAAGSSLPTITFSAGVTQVGSQENLAQVMTRADRALRRAKQAGKNRVVVAAAEVAPVG